jgi:hypothetical protein
LYSFVEEIQYIIGLLVCEKDYIYIITCRFERQNTSTRQQQEEQQKKIVLCVVELSQIV